MFTTILAQASPSEAAADVAAGAAVAGLAGFIIFVWILTLASFAIWLWALIDVIRRDFDNPSDKNLWLILVIVGFFVGGPIIPIIYLIVGRKKGVIRASR